MRRFDYWDWLMILFAAAILVMALCGCDCAKTDPTKPYLYTSEYVVIQAVDSYDLATKVNECMKQGYEPVGGVAITWHSGFIKSACQAMRKNRKDGDS